MRKTFTFLLLIFVLFFNYLNAQSFNPFQGLKPASDNEIEYCEQVEFFDYSPKVFQEIMEMPSQALQISAVIQGLKLNLILKPNNFINPAYFLSTDKQALVLSNTKSRFFTGTAENYPNSMVVLNFFEDELSGIISLGNGNIVIGKLGNDPTSRKHVIYNDINLKANNPFECHLEELPQNLEKMAQDILVEPAQKTDHCKKIAHYFECDYHMYQTRGSSVSSCENFVLGMFNVISTLLEREGVYTEVSQIKVWTSQDPYPSNGSAQALYSFGNYLKNNYTGNIATLLSTKPLGLGGIAWLDVLCTPNSGGSFGRYSYVNINNSYNQLPTYSWTINATTHELGHNYGSPHTHNCNWNLPNGKRGAIDSCYNSEGGCVSVSPRATQSGTIMSYCHLTSRGVDLNKGFGRLPGTLILNKFNAAPCVSGKFPANFLVNTNSPVCEGAELSLATNSNDTVVLWTGPNGFSSNQQNAFRPEMKMSDSGFYDLLIQTEGCERRARFEVKVNPRPEKSKLSKFGLDITSDKTDSSFYHTWYFNGQETNFTGATIKPDKLGFYSEKLTNKFGCFNYSDTLEFLDENIYPNQSPSLEILYPNPSSSTLNLRLSVYRSGNYKIKIFNSIGQLMHDTEYNISPAMLGIINFSYDISDLSEGNYFFVFEGSERFFTKKFIKIQ